MKKVLFSILIIGIDCLTKAFALSSIPLLSGTTYPFGGIGLVQFSQLSCSLNTIFNRGMIGGVFSDHSSFLLIARFAIIGALLVYLLVLSKRRADPFYLWLILAGAAGNVIDMCCYGHVVDFIHLRFFSWSFPVFNIADSCITIGACLLFLCSQKQRLSKCGAETE